MAEKITPREQDFSQWYHDVVLQARLADYSPVKGCMVIRPNGYAIWERLRAEMDRRIKATGTRNAYFPLFIPEGYLKKEADHVEGFAPEVAVVTFAGNKDLDEKLVVRPTSETIINSMFSKWIQSYRDLPLQINQWANVVRWEMRTRLFLRTTEFLWQEGHTCHSNGEESDSFAQQILHLYRDFCEEILAMPVYWGLKTDSEKFAGAKTTYCIEGMMQDKKALQAGTTHDLSSNFAKAFDTKYLAADNKEQFVHQTSWGVSTRLIGGVIMTHSDDKGLVLPPKLADRQVVIVPVLKKNKDNSEVLTAVEKLKKDIESQRDDLTVMVDTDANKQMGWKLHEYELLGIPVRIELGPRDLKEGHVMMARRDQEGKDKVSLNDVAGKIPAILDDMQSGLLERARKFRDDNTFAVTDYDELKKKIEEPGGFFEVPWGGDPAFEDRIKNDMKATIRCLPLDEKFKPIPHSAKCIHSGKSENVVKAIVGKSY